MNSRLPSRYGTENPSALVSVSPHYSSSACSEKLCSESKGQENAMTEREQLTLAAVHIDIFLSCLMGVIILVANGDGERVCGCHWWIAAVNHNHRQVELALPFPVESAQGSERGRAVPVILQVEVDRVK